MVNNFLQSKENIFYRSYSIVKKLTFDDSSCHISRAGSSGHQSVPNKSRLISIVVMTFPLIAHLVGRGLSLYLGWPTREDMRSVSWIMLSR